MSNLHDRPLTFLFTDIEGSTRLWEANPRSMRDSHARHWSIIAEAVQKGGGRIVRSRGEGDSTFTVFDDPAHAVAAACQFQRALSRETWPAETPIRVRAAVHVGPAELHEGDYNSPAVNRCARLRSLACGGQTLVTQAIYEAVRNHLPEGASLKDLGTHRLRDLQRPEKVYQLSHPDLPSEFPPLRSLDSLPTNLPQQLTTFVGREAEIEEVQALLMCHRLVTLTGAGGCGKTRLGIQAAAGLLDHYTDGVWVVELAPLADASLVPALVATTLGLREEAGRSITDTLINYLQTRTLLLMLDNCEHVVQAVAELADALLRSCPQLAVLATSQERLRVAGEKAWRVPSLSLPECADDLLERVPAPAELGRYEAVRLFVERAAGIEPGFTLTPANAPHVLQICRRLDGIPLALELAAARVNVLSPEKIAQRLDDRLRLLTGGIRTVLPRQKTLTALIDWSYGLLSDEERTLLNRLSVFSGGWTLEAAEAVCADDDSRESQVVSRENGGIASANECGPHRGSALTTHDSRLTTHELSSYDILDLLSHLVDRSLVVAEQGDVGADRYRLLESLRQYAAEKLREATETETVRGRHRTFFAELAEEAEPYLTGPEQVEWLDRLQRERDNLRAMLDSCRSTPEAHRQGLRAAERLWRFWWLRGYFREGRDWLACFLDRVPAGTDEPRRAGALNGAGWLAGGQGDYEGSRTLLEEAIEIETRLGDRAGLATSLQHLGVNRAMVGSYQAAQELFERALALQREIGDHRGSAMSVLNLANVLIYQREWDPARRRLSEARDLFQDLGDTQGIALALNNLGHVATHQGDYPAARAWFSESLEIACRLGFKTAIGGCLDGLAKLAYLEREAERAGCLFAVSDTLRATMNSPLPPEDRADFDHHVAVVRQVLGEDTFRQTWEEGRTMSLIEAVTYALADARRGVPAVPSEHP